MKCGKEILSEADFCPHCGFRVPSTGGTTIYEQQQPPTQREYVPSTSRLSGLGIEKYIMPGEIVSFTTAGSMYVGPDSNLKASVTNRGRFLFYGKKGGVLGLVLKGDYLKEIPLHEIRNFRVIETGLLVKKTLLHLDDLEVKGDREDILGLYAAIQKQNSMRH